MLPACDATETRYTPDRPWWGRRPTEALDLTAHEPTPVFTHCAPGRRSGATASRRPQSNRATVRAYHRYTTIGRAPRKLPREPSLPSASSLLLSTPLSRVNPAIVHIARRPLPVGYARVSSPIVRAIFRKILAHSRTDRTGSARIDQAAARG